MRGYTVFIVLMTLAAVLLFSDAVDTDRHRAFNLVIVAIMFCGAALDLTLWMRRQRFRGRADPSRNP